MLINPPAALFGTDNAVLHGRGSRYESRFSGPLSVKAVVSGSATWETAAGRYELMPGAALVIHEDEEYTVTVDALRPVETFCFFFADGFVEDAFRAATTCSEQLLDTQVAPPRITFAERLQFDTPLVAELRRAHAHLGEGHPLEASFYATAMQLVRARCDLDARAERLPALRAATRGELARRVAIGTSFLHANLDRAVTVAEAAREACLSPFHFHRLFASFHGVTPHRYLTQLRLTRARALLRSGTRTVADVAFACGFSSLGSFTTLFTRNVGMSPARFRRIEETA
ncbi:MAG TPA: AraC family transcriptional regulator [Thermoanaerobaculia bacterium]|nr:AraC family transcriptional regulator [Thermoanaerobaculia bacterium]